MNRKKTITENSGGLLRHAARRMRCMAAVLLVLPASLSAQYTFPDLACQIRLMEMAPEGGTITPALAAYYENPLGELINDGYAMKLRRLGKLQLRRAMVPLLDAERSHAEALDSALAERKRIEELNFLDYTIDEAGRKESDKIETALASLHADIGLILTVDSTAAALRSSWLDIERMLRFGYHQISRSGAVMPNAERHRQYIAIEEDIRSRSEELHRQLGFLRARKSLVSQAAPDRKERVSAISAARASLSLWQSRAASVNRVSD